MAESDVSKIPVYQIPRVNPGYLYIIQAGGRLKVGKSKDSKSRLRAAKTWLPDMTLVGIKPFWNVDKCERELHEGLAQWWYDGEWFHPGDDPYLEGFISNFCAFSDNEDERDANSVNFLYWMHDFLELALERSSRGNGLRAFQREVSDVKKRPK